MSDLPKAVAEKRDELGDKYLSDNYKNKESFPESWFDGFNSCAAELLPLVREMREILVEIESLNREGPYQAIKAPGIAKQALERVDKVLGDKG